MFKFKRKKNKYTRRFSYGLLHSTARCPPAAASSTEQADSIFGPAHPAHCPNSVHDRPETASLIDLLTGLANEIRPRLKQTGLARNVFSIFRSVGGPSQLALE